MDDKQLENLLTRIGYFGDTDIMFTRLDEYEQNLRKLDPHEKAIFFYAYTVARVDAQNKDA